jgi:hypothetical protein
VLRRTRPEPAAPKGGSTTTSVGIPHAARGSVTHRATVIVKNMGNITGGQIAQDDPGCDRLLSSWFLASTTKLPPGRRHPTRFAAEGPLKWLHLEGFDRFARMSAPLSDTLKAAIDSRETPVWNCRAGNSRRSNDGKHARLPFQLNAIEDEGQLLQTVYPHHRSFTRVRSNPPFSWVFPSAPPRRQSTRA